VRLIGDHRFDVFSPYSISGSEIVSAAVIGAAVGLLAWRGNADPWLAMASVLLGFMMVLVTAIDRRLFLIPDALSLPAAGLGLLATLAAGPGAGLGSLANHLVACLAAATVLFAVRALYWHWRGVEGMGLGDVKLGAAAGAWVGLDGIAATFLIACISALSIVLIQRLRGRSIAASAAVPFGSFIAPAVIVVWLAEMWSF
jgi:leader peptidase (prepilin peptidase)/N-methyltransferase